MTIPDPATRCIMGDAETPNPFGKSWRSAERARLIGARLDGLTQEERTRHAGEISRRLVTVLGPVAGKAISLYWPFRGEPDLRPLIDRFTDEGATCLLPIATRLGERLTFRSYQSGDRLVRGLWDIPVPEGGERMEPDIVIAPVVGFDRRLYRLGYGGGFFDRTLESLGPSALAIGVGYDSQAIPTIHPHRHDIPMAIIITQSRILRQGGQAAADGPEP